MKKMLLTLGAAAITMSASATMRMPENSTCAVKPGVPTANSKSYGKLQTPCVIGKALKTGAQRAAEDDFGLITEAPEGKLTTMLGSSQTFYIYYDEVAMDETFGSAYEGVFTESGEVYLKNPVSMLDWDTYIKGKVTDEGLQFDFPQILYVLDDEEEGFELYVDVLEYTEVESPDNPDDYYVTFEPSEETRSITFTKMGDGSYAMLDDFMMGVTWEGIWQGYGEMYLTLQPFEATVSEVPEGIDYDYSYLLADELNGWDHTVLRTMAIGEADGVTYIKGISNSMPDAVIHGVFDKETNTLTIPSDQFLGKYYNHYIFMMVGEGYSYYDEDWGEDMISFDITDDPMVLKYDPETNVYTPVIPEGYEFSYIIFNFGNTETYPCEYYAVDRIFSQGEITDYAPIAPEVIAVNEIQMFDPEYSYAFEFNIFGDNEEGQILIDNNIYYNIFINGELFTFTAEEYPLLEDEGIEEITDIPVFLNVGDDIFASGNYHGVAFKRKDIETIGVRAVYIDGEIRGESKIVTIDTNGDPVGVSAIEASAAEVSEIYDLNGRRISGHPGKGVFIKRTVLSDGSIRTEKRIGMTNPSSEEK